MKCPLCGMKCEHRGKKVMPSGAEGSSWWCGTCLKDWWKPSKRQPKKKTKKEWNDA